MRPPRGEYLPSTHIKLPRSSIEAVAKAKKMRVEHEAKEMELREELEESRRASSATPDNPSTGPITCGECAARCSTKDAFVCTAVGTCSKRISRPYEFKGFETHFD